MEKTKKPKRAAVAYVCRCGNTFESYSRNAKQCPECETRKIAQALRTASNPPPRPKTVQREECEHYLSRSVPGTADERALATACRKDGFANVCRLLGRCRFCFSAKRKAS